MGATLDGREHALVSALGLVRSKQGHVAPLANGLAGGGVGHTLHTHCKPTRVLAAEHLPRTARALARINVTQFGEQVVIGTSGGRGNVGDGDGQSAGVATPIGAALLS